MKWMTSEKLKETLNQLRLLGAIILFGLLLFFTALILLWPVIFALVWSYFHEVQEYVVVRFFATLLLLGLAKQLYDIRSLFRHWYGAAEVVIGMIICWVVLRNLEAPRMNVTIALAGAVYLMVRGIDNYKEGREQRTKLLEDPVDESSGQIP